MLLARLCYVTFVSPTHVDEGNILGATAADYGDGDTDRDTPATRVLKHLGTWLRFPQNKNREVKRVVVFSMKGETCKLVSCLVASAQKSATSSSEPVLRE